MTGATLELRDHFRSLAPLFALIAAVWALRLVLDAAGAPHAIVRLSTVTERWRDRKSTRLNSSHITNSYAVFCLKKKRTTHKPNYPKRKHTGTMTNNREH